MPCRLDSVAVHNNGIYVMNLSLLQKKSVTAKTFMNFPRKLEYLSSGDQVEQIFHPKYRHILEKFYRFLVAKKSVEDFICMIALSDFERYPTKLKRDFIMQHFVDDKNSLYFINISGKNRRSIRQSVKVEDIASLESHTQSSCLSRAIVRNEKTPLLLPQMPNTFTSTSFKAALRLNISEMLARFKNMDDIEIMKSINCPGSEFSVHHDMIESMVDAGFKVPRFIYNIPSI